MNQFLYKFAAKYEEEKSIQTEDDPSLPENATVEEADEPEKPPKDRARDLRKLLRAAKKKKRKIIPEEESLESAREGDEYAEIQKEKNAHLMKLAACAVRRRSGNPVYNLRSKRHKHQKPSVGLAKLMAIKERLAKKE